MAARADHRFHQAAPESPEPRNNIRLRRFAEADAVLERLRRLVGADYEWVLYIQGFWHFSQGQLAEARAILERLKTLREADGTPSNYTYHVGALSLDLGDIDEGLTWFERACDERHWFIPFAQVHFAGDQRVISDRRFQALLKRMNLDTESLRRLRRMTEQQSLAG
jgi:tetratricopeptide (TPR) repeat protein